MGFNPDLSIANVRLLLKGTNLQIFVITNLASPYHTTWNTLRYYITSSLVSGNKALQNTKYKSHTKQG